MKYLRGTHPYCICRSRGVALNHILYFGKEETGQKVFATLENADFIKSIGLITNERPGFLSGTSKYVWLCDLHYWNFATMRWIPELRAGRSTLGLKFDSAVKCSLARWIDHSNIHYDRCLQKELLDLQVLLATSDDWRKLHSSFSAALNTQRRVILEIRRLLRDMGRRNRDGFSPGFALAREYVYLRAKIWTLGKQVQEQGVLLGKYLNHSIFRLSPEHLALDT